MQLSEQTAQYKHVKRNLFSRLTNFIKFLPRIVWVILAVAVVLALLFLLFFKSNLFLVSQIEISELVYTDREEIYDKNKKYLGERIFSVDPTEIETKVADLSPYIKTVDVEKILPNKLRIKVSERYPSLRIQHVPTAQNFVIDDELIVLEVNPSLETLGYLDLSLVQVNFDVYGKLLQKPGKMLNLDGLDFVIDIKKKLSQTKIEIDQTKEMLLGQSSLEVTLKTGTKVLMDPNRDVDDQIDRLKAILEDTKKKNKDLVYVDVSLEKPFGKYK